jgi:hypothetical protein
MRKIKHRRLQFDADLAKFDRNSEDLLVAFKDTNDEMEKLIQLGAFPLEDKEEEENVLASEVL